jgi:2-dehydro-3-deoxygluconokinase
VNAELIKHADVVFGIEGFDPTLTAYNEKAFRSAAEKMMSRYPDLKVLATTLRDIHSASRHSLSAVCFVDDEVFRAADRANADVLDRVGSGDAFAAGLIYGFLTGKSTAEAIEIGVAAAALSLSSVGDGLSATWDEIGRAVRRSDNAAIR